MLVVDLHRGFECAGTELPKITQGILKGPLGLYLVRTGHPNIGGQRAIGSGDQVRILVVQGNAGLQAAERVHADAQA